jgi:hypothetical protein
MANNNQPGQHRKAKLRRRRCEVARFIERCEASSLEAQGRGEQPTDHTREIRDFRRTMKLRK